MKATITVTDLLSTRGRVEVLRVLWQSRQPLTAAEISRRAELTYPATSAVLDTLVHLRVADRAPAGRGHTHWLVRENQYVHAYLAPIFESEEELPERLEDDIRSLFAERCVSVVLFGSYARGSQTLESDVDVIAVAQNTDEKQRIERELAEIEREFRQRWGAPLSVILYDPHEAATLHHRSPALYSTLVDEGLAVSGLLTLEWRKLEPG
jgi:predicted nucleotidyltransferase